MGRLSTSDSSLVSSLVLYGPLGIILFIVFLFLRKWFPRFYAARRNHGYPSPPQSGEWFGWWTPTMGYSERDMISTHGLDAVMILRYCRTCLWLLLCMFFFCWILIAPINSSPSHVFLDNCTCDINCDDCRISNPLYARGTSIISLSNINPNSKSDRTRLWAHIVGVYVFSLFALYLLYRDWLAFTDLRVRHFTQRRIATSSVLVQGLGLPEGAPLDESENAIAAYFSRLFPNEVARVIVAAKGNAIRSLMKGWNKVIRKTERETKANRLEKQQTKKELIRAKVNEHQSHLCAGKV